MFFNDTYIIALRVVNFNRNRNEKSKNIEKMTKEPMAAPPHRMLREVFAMKFYYVTFRSVTHGQRGEKLLKSNGVRCHLLRTPKWMEARGCGYSLRIWTKEPMQAVAALRASGIPLRKVYLQREDGEMEELRL